MNKTIPKPDVKKNINQYADNMSRTFGENLKRIRKVRGLSLDDVSNMTSVSVSMLSEIERGVKTPSISILYKICEGISVSYNSLLRIPIPEIEIAKGDQLEAHGGMEAQVLFKHNISNPLEFTKNRIPPHSSHAAESHGDNTYEVVMVKEGRFTLHLGDRKYVINEGDALRFMANVHHVYANETDKDVIIYNCTVFAD